MGSPTDGLGAAWWLRVDALGHLAERPDADRSSALAALRSACHGALDELSVACRAAGLRPTAIRAALDPFAEVLGDAEDALEGCRSVPGARDVRRRRDARELARPPVGTFFQKHGAAVVAIWRRDGRA